MQPVSVLACVYKCIGCIYICMHMYVYTYMHIHVYTALNSEMLPGSFVALSLANCWEFAEMRGNL